MRIRSNKAVVAMLKTAREQLTTDPQLVASMLQGVMVEVSRRLLESTAPEKLFDTLLEETIFLACAYLNACSTRSNLC
jgi:Tetracyclin repressor-like, C-terminal domain